MKYYIYNMKRVKAATILFYILVFCFLTEMTLAANPQNGMRTFQDRVDQWSEIAIDDLHFIRAILRENHPGPADTLNPWFRSWYERGFDEALELASQAENYAGYYFSIQYYMQGFQDGHLGALGEDLLAVTELDFRWPGFIVGYKLGQFQVIESEEPRVPVGATLISCDGRSADSLGKTILQTFHGLWSVNGARSDLAPLLFVDAGNPFVEPLKVSKWNVRGQVSEVSLIWRPVDVDSLQAKISKARQQFSPPFEVRRFAEGAGYWISIPSFAIGSEEVREGIQNILTTLEKDGDKIRSGEIIVIDVRGNGGGSSTLGDEIIAKLWGTATLDEAQPGGHYVEWRVSAGNASFLRRVNLSRWENYAGEDDPAVRDYRKFVEEMEMAVTKGDIFYRRGKGESTDAKEPASGTRYQVKARVFFLTDNSCFSACLDFADVMRRIPGVVHIGLETKADAVYIDNRAVRLPSGHGMVGFSMKVYRNRQRAHNESYIPELVWNGNITDNIALENWILNLAQSDLFEN
jgi:hypothetical protein